MYSVWIFIYKFQDLIVFFFSTWIWVQLFLGSIGLYVFHAPNKIQQWQMRISIVIKKWGYMIETDKVYSQQPWSWILEFAPKNEKTAHKSKMLLYNCVLFHIFFHMFNIDYVLGWAYLRTLMHSHMDVRNYGWMI